MKKIVFYTCYLFFISIIFLNSGCKKEQFLSEGNLTFSLDTLVFDTVFTTIGSTTKQFKIYNRGNQTLNIDQIELMGGSTSPFRINVDGLKGTAQSNIEIEKNDSLFVFVEVTLGVNGQNLPMVVEDSIRFRSNGKDQYVHLAVWGQDAYFHYQEVLTPTGNLTWPNDKPHVIYDYCTLGFEGIDSLKSLTIQAGTQIYFHKNSILYIYKGELHVQGQKDNEVVFQGDRLESFYEDVAGQWYGIYFNQAKPSTINYAIIKNGTAGIHTYSRYDDSPNYTVDIKNTKILNHASYGVFLYSGSKIKLENTLIAKCSRNAFFVLEGGDFNINHCDLLGYGDSQEQNIAFAVKNYFTQEGKTYVGSVNEGKIYNSVIYGYQEDEFAIDTINPQNQVTLNFDFRNCLIRRTNPPSNSSYQNILWNSDPLFDDIEKNNYHYSTASPLNGAANPLFSMTLDLDGLTRSATNPDIGCYEQN